MAFGIIVPYSQVSKLVSVKVNASGFLSLGLHKTSNYKISDKPEPKYSMQKSDGLACGRYHYYVEHPLTDVISEPRDCNKQRPKVSFRYDPLGRRISKPASSCYRAGRLATPSRRVLCGKATACCRKSTTGSR